MKFYHKVIFITLGILGIILFSTMIWYQYSDIIQSFFNYTFDRETLIDLLRHQGRHNAILFIAIIAIGSAIPGVPIAAVAILSGVCFGRWLGFGVNVIGAVIGNMLAINILGSFPHKVRPSRFRPLADKLKNMHHPRLGLSIGYAVPMLPTLLVNYAAIEMKLSWRNKLICIFLGSLPVSFLYAFGGDELIFGNIKVTIIAILIVVLMIALYDFIRRDQRIKQSI
ncbi:TVP38/TMEM64 family protein [Companilactobacillus paralimentarius]|uniref:TVP38/TMEM64 family protein n=1 Tax=Companilactobacillus paralimentarius TaxID=83526 RepID=UPI00384ACE09